MTLLTLRPSSTVGITATVVGAGSAESALADNSDASYILANAGELATLGLTDLTLPAGAVINNVLVRARCAADVNGVPTEITAVLIGAGPQAQLVATVSSSTISTLSGGAVVGWTDAQLDAAMLRVLNNGTRDLRTHEAYVDVRIVNQPVVTVTAPTGTITTTNQPVVTWTEVIDADGGPQTASQIKVFTAAQYGIGGFNPDTSPNTWDSTINGGTELARQVGVILPDATYRAYVRVAQTVNGAAHWSAWAFSQFTISVALPAVPTIALTPSATNGRMSVLVTPVAGTATTNRLELQRTLDAGVTWTPVRNTYGNDGLILQATAATVLDYEAPNGSTVGYRARSAHSYSGEFASSAWSATSNSSWTSTDWWIKHPNISALNLKLTRSMFSYADVNRAARQTAMQPLGAALPIVISDTRAGATGTIVVQLATLVEQNALDTLLDETSTLLLQGPVAEGHPDRYIRFGDHASVRKSDNSWSLPTMETLPWIQVASPPGAQI